MARSASGKGFQISPGVTFSLGVRPATYAQLEAGKRLFSRLVERAQDNKKQQNIAKAQAQAGAEAPPAE